MNKYYLLIIIFFLTFLSSTAQQYTGDEVKSAYIFNFGKYVKWDNEEKTDTFKIGVFEEDSSMYRTLEKMVKISSVKEKPVSVLHFKNVIDITATQILYVSNEYNYEIEKIFEKIQGNNTLLITNKCAKQEFVMINFLPEKKETICFEINKMNITDNNLIALPELLLIGGTEIDVRELYKETEKELQTEKEKVEQSEIEIKRQKEEIQKQNEEISRKQVLISEQQEKINKHKNELNKLFSEIREQQEKLYAKTKTLKEQGTEIINQQKEIIKQKKDVESQNIILESKKDEIHNHQNKIEAQKKEINEQFIKIKTQRNILFLFVFLIVLFICLVFIIYSWYRTKRESNKKLSEKNIEISQQKEEILTQSEELRKLSIVASETDNAVIIANEKGEIEWVNEGFARVFEYNLAEFIALKGSNFIQTSSNPDIEKDIEKCREHKVSVNYISRSKTKSGRDIWLQTTLTPIFDFQDNIIKFIAIDSDITKLKQAEEEILARNEQIASQRDQILRQNNEILSSILYAGRIQKAIFPPEEFLNEILGEYFIYNKPRDIVSGDFYWATKIRNEIILTAADCTGHGVPGALMSMISVSFLNKIVNERKILEPEKILDKLKINTIEALHQTGKEYEASDGMDIALINIDTKSLKLKFAGAMNPVWFFRDKELHEIKGDRMAIGYDGDRTRKFTVEEIQMQKDDMIYLFSDGYYDQFGGNEDTRFLKRNFRALLKKIHLLKMPEQKQKLEENYIKWKGKYKQVDDILIMGIRL